MKLLFSLLGLLFTYSLSAQYELNWNAQIAGTMHDDSRGMIKINNDIFICGRIEATPAIISGTTFSTETAVGLDDIFIAKLTKNGVFQWVKTMGGMGSEQAVAISNDGQGNIYITGFFENSFDFNPGAGTSTVTASGQTDGFVAKFDTNGNLIWVNQISGPLTEKVEGITVLADGVVVTGRFEGTIDADPSGALAPLTSNGLMDVFVIKYDLTGNYQWSANYGSAQGDIGWGVSSDNSNNIYVTGVFKNTKQFETGNPSSLHSSNGMSDVFILKLNNLGAYQWSKSFGSTGDETGKEIFIGPSSAIFATGFYEGTVDFDPGIGVSNTTSNGADDSYLLKLDSNGDFEWIHSIGGIDVGDNGKAVDFDSNNSIYYTGTFGGTVNLGGTNFTSNGLSDCFVEKLDQQGNVLWATTYGTVNDDFVNAVIVDADTSLYLDGKFDGTMDIDPSATTTNITTAGSYDGYIMKWTLTGFFGAGIDKNQNDALVVYPNPSNGNISIAASDSKIEFITIYNSLGQKVFALIVSDTKAELNLDELESGIYTLIIETEKGQSQKQIVLQ